MADARPFLPQEIIRAKRERHALPDEAVRAFVEGLTSQSFSEGQVAAFAMAVCLNGMSRDETVALTLAMRDSGTVLDWSDLPGPVTDKHSSGGVGDNISLMLAPIVAACGAFVPMISGRGLGHTGGTLDKMDAIPGYRSQPEQALFARTVRDAGCAIIGQTADLAPADRRFYAIRDVTATVESVPLITASILSKKLAAGLQSLVLDVKCGNGAFMASGRQAGALARSLVEVAGGAGLPVSALVSDMNQPLADAAGNALEVRHAIDFLGGRRRERRVLEVTLALAAEMLVLARLASNSQDAISMARRALEDGRAAERFARMVTALGGPADIVENADLHLPRARVERPATHEGEPGFVSRIDTRALGLTVVALGGGRRHPDDRINHSVGLSQIAPLASRIQRGDPLAVVHARDDHAADAAIAAVRACYEIAASRPPARARSAILRRIGSG